MWATIKRKKRIDIYPVANHICSKGQQNDIVKTCRIQDGESPARLLIQINKKTSVNIDINNCPFCGKKI